MRVSWRIGMSAARRGAAAVAVAGAAAVLAWAPPASAASANAIVQTGVNYEIVAYQGSPTGSKCVDVPGGSTTPGQRLQVFHCHGFDRSGAPQLFFFVDMGGGYYQVQNLNSHLCFELPNSSGADGTEIEQAGCVGWDSQQWRIQVLYNGIGTGPVFGLVNKAFPSKCLTWQGGVTPADHDKLVMVECFLPATQTDPGNPAQLWWLG